MFVKQAREASLLAQSHAGGAAPASAIPSSSMLSLLTGLRDRDDLEAARRLYRRR